MLLDNQVDIRARPETITAAAYQVERWPDLLPHYRWVRVVSQRADPPGSRLVIMAARRGPLPLKWRARQWVDEQAHRVYFRHVGGPCRGMEVVWEIDPAPEQPGVCRVTIRHDLSYPIPILGPFIAKYIVGPFFISPTANRTLHCFKGILEGKTTPEEPPK